jgi:CheY-like chemotaxis protein
MPVLDGFDSTIKIRELEVTSGTHVPIIALTGDVIYGTKEQCLKVGM